MRHVLIITHDFPPRGRTGVLRVTKFVRYLPQFGWKPIVIAAAATGVVPDETLIRQVPPDVEVIRVPNPLIPQPAHQFASAIDGRRRSGLAGLRARIRRYVVPDPMVTWVPGAVLAACARLRRGDVDAVMTTSPPHSVQLVGLCLKRLFPELPWLLDFRDLWSESPVIKDPVIYRLNRAMEVVCVRNANQIVVVTDGFRRLLSRQHALADARVSTITNGFDAEDIPANMVVPRHAALRITYTGTIVGTRVAAARGLFAALHHLVDQGIGAGDLQLHLIGIFDSEVHEWAAPFVARGMVKMVPHMSHADAVREMAVADVLLLLVPDDWEWRIMHTNKLFEYFAVGRPILALAPDGDLARLVHEAHAGESISPEDVGGIMTLLRDLMERHRSGQLHGQRPNDPRFERFERRSLAHALAATLDRLVG